MNPETAPQLRIFLDHASNSVHPGSSIKYWSPVDSLAGHLELHNAELLAIDEISIYFEGLNVRIKDFITTKNI
jgi:hypothetical protein